MQGEATSLEKTPGICMQIFMAASFIITIFKKEIPFLIYKLRENGILLSNKWNELLILTTWLYFQSVTISEKSQTQVIIRLKRTSFLDPLYMFH